MLCRLARPIVGGLALVVATGSARAEEFNCADPQSNVEITNCAKQDFEAADEELNRVYKLALEGISKQDQLTPKQRKDWADAFRKAQRNWIAFKDLDCGEVIGWEWYGGTGMASAAYACLVAKTEARAKEIRERYQVD